jgi:hypothetical protein
MAATDPYIDNGHPYWTMLSYTLFSIPKHDPFWVVHEEALPVEQDDYVIRFEAPRMIVTGTKSSGQVKWLQARNVPKREPYRDKYTKLVCSSHFPLCTMKEKDFIPWDQAVVFRDAEGKCAAREGVTDGTLIEDGVETTWTTTLHGGLAVAVATQVRLAGEFELRTHSVSAHADALKGWTLIDGSHALPLAAGEEPAHETGENWIALRTKNGYAVASWRLGGYEASNVTSSFDPQKQTRVNIIHRKCAVVGHTAKLEKQPLVFTSLHYASPKAGSAADIQRRAAGLLKSWGIA